MEKSNNKGQASLTVPVIMAGATILASVFGSWGLSNAKVQVIEERENNHYNEVQKQLESIERKLDSVIANHQTKK